MSSTTAHAALASKFRSLHVPASWAVVASAGKADNSLDLDTDLAAVRAIALTAKQHSLPLTVDLRDGYGAQLEQAIDALLACESVVVGINFEDVDRGQSGFFPISEAAERIKTVLAVAKRAGVDKFVVNARADSLLHGGTLAECVDRGKAYLAAGATTVFVLGGSEGRKSLTSEEVPHVVSELSGMVNIGMKLGEGNMTARELAGLGIARISLGPKLQVAAMETLRDEAMRAMAR